MGSWSLFRSEDGEVSTTYINWFISLSSSEVNWVFHSFVDAALNPSLHEMYAYPPFCFSVSSSVELNEQLVKEIFDVDSSRET